MFFTHTIYFLRIVPLPLSLSPSLISFWREKKLVFKKNAPHIFNDFPTTKKIEGFITRYLCFEDTITMRHVRKDVGEKV